MRAIQSKADLDAVLVDCIARYKKGIEPWEFELESSFKERQELWKQYLRRFIRACHEQINATPDDQEEA
jgi:uncharacterized protein YukE